MAPHVESASTTSESPLKEPQMKTRKDRLAEQNEKYERIVHYIRHGKHQTGLSKNQQRVVRLQAKNYVMDETNNELYYTSGKVGIRKKVVLTLEEISEILHLHHSNAMGGHSGVNATLNKISNYYCWNGMKEDVQEYIMSCHQCQTYSKIKTQAPDLIPIRVNEALELVGIDLIGPLPTTAEGYKYVCTFTDYFTKFVDFYPLKMKSADGVAKCIKTFTCRWGAPTRLLSDQGREFVAKVNDEVCREFGIKRSVTSAYHPQTNGLDERTNQTLKQRLSKLVNNHQNDWCNFLDEVAYSIRTQKQATTKYTPFFLMFGRNPNSPQMMTVVEDSSSVPDQDEDLLDKQVDERIALSEATCKEVLTNVGIAQEKQKKQYQKRKAKGVKTFDIKVGDTVYKKQMKNVSRKGGKMEPTWTGPYRVTEIDKSQRATLISLKDGAVPLKKKVPYDQLQPCMTSELHKLKKDDITPPCDNTKPPCDNTTPPCDDTTPPCPCDDITPPSPCDNSTPPCPCDDTTPPCDDTTPPCPCDDITPPSPCDNSTPPCPCDDTTPPCPSDNTKPPCDDTTLPTTDRDKAHNGNTSKTINKNIKSKGINSTTTRKTKMSGRGRKKRNGEVLHCSANANPGRLALTLMQQNYWLTDEHIDHVQWLISKQFQAVKGFYSVLAFESKPPKVEKGQKEFVQIINAGGSHWVTVTNIGCEENKIKVYDSLYRNLSANDKMKLAALLNTTLPNMVIEWPRMQKQEGISDCGLFATAVAVSLCSGHDPSVETYDQSVMREHLAMCFMCEELAVFPLTQSNCVVNGRLEEMEELFCHCRMPYTEDQFMIECSECLGWFHRSCDNVPKTVRANTSFQCMNCK